MVKKKVKNAKASRKRGGSWQVEEVEVNTGLPPQVEGQLRCFCRVSVDQILWLVPNTPELTHIRTKWWGEDGDGSLFRPVDVKKGGPVITKTTARYAVRSGPKQFSSYLNDMGCLTLEVLSGPMLSPVGQAEVTQIGQLSPNRPINGFFPVFSPTEEKIGEVHASLVLEPLMASYDSMGSIPTTDVSMDTHSSRVTQESTVPKRSLPVPHAEQPRKPIEDPFISPASHQATDPRMMNGYAEDLRQRLNYGGSDPAESQYQSMATGGAVAITTNGHVIRTGYEGIQGKRDPSPSGHNQRGADFRADGSGNSDLLSVLLDRGNKLREKMIISAIDSNSKQTEEHATTGHGFFPASQATRSDPNISTTSLRSSNGDFLREILQAEKALRGTGDLDMGDDPVDLVFGDHLVEDIRMLKNLHGSPNVSVSSAGDLSSDEGDPIHSESLLNELFYNNLASGGSDLSDLSEDEVAGQKLRANMLDDPTNMRPPSRASSASSLNLAFPADPPSKKSKGEKTPKRRKSRTKVNAKGSKKRRSSRSNSRSRSRSCVSGSEASDSEALSTASTPRSECSRVSFDMVPSDIDEPPERGPTSSKKITTDGLSVERLTLLGRVHVARVTIDNLLLHGRDNDTSTSKSRSKLKYGTKPPRPSPKSKKASTYFIEYQFPVVATSRDKYSPNAMATEVMRVVSRNVKSNVVGFSHRSVFPVMFDGTAVERWWKSALVFKVYSRVAGQKVPSLIGSCGIPLKSILKSESLHIDRGMEVRENGRNTSLNGSSRLQGEEGLVGSLKVVIELASDSREFPTALARTKLAEMTGKVKIVPIPQHSLPPKPPPAPPIPERITTDLPRPRTPIGLEAQARAQASESSQEPATTSSSGAGYHTKSSSINQSDPVSIQHYHGSQAVIHAPMMYQDPMDMGPQPMTLHTLVVIPDGRNITMQGVPSLLHAKKRPVFQQPTCQAAPGIRARDLSVRNTYLVCRMFWCDEAVHSDVCWGTTEPVFNFTQIAPVLMTQSLMERLRNNFMVVEVWDKKTSSDNDKLVGIVKLSLHQFFLSFRDKKIASALLKSQYPVISVDNYLPVVDPFSGSQYGQIKVLVAMGSAEQVAHLQRMKMDVSASTAPERPLHFLERQDLVGQNAVPSNIGTEVVVEHIFEVVVEGVRGMTLFENMIWGEADCFVQYHFPTQVQTNPPGAPVIRHAVPSMKAYRTATTLCIPDPTFNDVTRHRIYLPQGTPVQRELLTACANSGGGSGGVPFEIWCRYYHPNVRDQCIAKASLPLAKLCAMITMQKRGEPSVQTFSFPLTPIPIDNEFSEPAKAQGKDSGLMDVTVHYKTQTIQSDARDAVNKNLSGAQVCLSVGVVRASGLKAAAEQAARLDSGMQYPAEVGVNSYVKVKLSFLGNEGERVTRTVARSFSPDFSHFMDFPCPLLWTEPDSDALCLAELLESAEATFEIWHQIPGLATDMDRQLLSMERAEVTGRSFVEKTKDVLLGSTTLPLHALLTHRTGYTGWFTVNTPIVGWNKDQEENREADEGQGQKGLQRVGGGLELNIKFAHHDDRERVIHAARGVGWSPIDVNIEEDDWQSEDEESNKYHHITVTIDHVNFPLQNALIAGHNTLDKTAHCYIRYKFYDKAPVMSKFSPLTVNSSGYITSQPRNKHDLQIPDSSPFRWYLREERLEVQVWVSYGTRQGDEQRPKHRDKLIGSAYISMESLSDTRRKQHRVSNRYPLFKPGGCDLGGAYLRAHVTSKPQFGVVTQSGQSGNMTILDEAEIDEDYDPDDSFHQLNGQSKPTPGSPKVTASEEKKEEEVPASFTALIAVERAMHLPRITDKSKSEEHFPNTYVSYPTAESTIQSYSDVFFNSDNPLWNHEHEAQLSTEMLTVENKNLVFKVWHKPAGSPKEPDKLTDRVLGFVSVDLTPLASGLQQVCGWYNIMDFTGQVKGQIKISVIPQATVIQQQGVAAVQNSFHLLPPTTASFLSVPPWGVAAPPSDMLAPPLSLPQFNQHYENVKQHHESLQLQLQDNIQQFLQRQEDNHAAPEGLSEGPALPREASIHWQPHFPEFRQEESTSRSLLFSSLRRNLQDLDSITKNLRSKLTVSSTTPSYLHDNQNQNAPTEFDIQVSGQSGQYPLTSTQSTISSYELPRSQRGTPRDELALTGSQGGDTSRTAQDSGAFSADHSNDKYDQEAPDSQRSGSDRLDTFRLGGTPRDFIPHTEYDSGYNHKDISNSSNNDELAFNIGLATPREASLKEDEYSASGGFTYKYSPRVPVSPRNVSSSGEQLSAATRGRLSASDITNQPNTIAEQSDKDDNVLDNQERDEAKQMSIIQEFPEENEGNGSDSEDESQQKFYHRYRDILDAEDNDVKSEESDSENEDEGEVVVPRRINDVSGKFTPAGEITMLNQELGSQSVPYALSSIQSHQFSPRTIPKDSASLERLEDEQHSHAKPQQEVVEQIVFDEKDSWLSDSEKEDLEHGDNVVNYMFDPDSVHAGKHKHRQDSDTGYSSRDNVSESYLGPGVLGTHSEADMSHLKDLQQWDKEEGEEEFHSDRRKKHLLSNVDLESTLSGSREMKGDSGRASRISSAGSRNTQRTMSDQSSDFPERLEEEPSSGRSEKFAQQQPVSARTDELEDFFGASHQHQGFERHRSDSISSTEEVAKHPDQTGRGEEDDSFSGETRNHDMQMNGDIYSDDDDEEDKDDQNDRDTYRESTGFVSQKHSEQRLPNFFMPIEHLEESMKAVQLATDKSSSTRQKERSDAMADLSSKLTRDNNSRFGHVTAKGKQLPTAEETKRIAKIFAAKFS